MKKICTFAGLLCVSVSMYAQSIKISGVVTDEMGPVMGASVMVKGTKTGTVTDVNGRYTLSADRNDVLVFSYVGTNPVEKTVTGAVLDVNLTSNVQSINEVVVTAIGIKQEKKKLGYTTQQVEGADIAAAETSTPEPHCRARWPDSLCLYPRACSSRRSSHCAARHRSSCSTVCPSSLTCSTSPART